MSKRNISYTQQDEPAFLKRFKEKIGYKEGPDINAKRCMGPPEDGDSDEEERDEDKPVIVVLKKGDLDADEVARLGGDSSKDQSADDEAAGGRIMFKKPKKTTTESNSELKKSSSSKSKETDHSAHSKKNKTKTLKNTTLLSFTEDEECDD